MPPGRLLSPLNDFSNLFRVTAPQNPSIIRISVMNLQNCVLYCEPPASRGLWPLPFKAPSLPVIVPSVDLHPLFLFFCPLIVSTVERDTFQIEVTVKKINSNCEEITKSSKVSQWNKHMKLPNMHVPKPFHCSASGDTHSVWWSFIAC